MVIFLRAKSNGGAADTEGCDADSDTDSDDESSDGGRVNRDGIAQPPSASGAVDNAERDRRSHDSCSHSSSCCCSTGGRASQHSDLASVANASPHSVTAIPIESRDSKLEVPLQEKTAKYCLTSWHLGRRVVCVALLAIAMIVIRARRRN